MAEFPALPLWTDAYLADTGHLTNEEHGLYLKLLILLWRSPGQRIPNDAEWIQRRFRGDAAAMQRLIDEFCKRDKWITQDRLSREFQYLAEQSEKQRERANSRWHKDKGPCRGNADVGNAPTPTPTPTPTKNKNLVSLEFEKFKRAYPKRRGGQGWPEAQKYFEKAVKSGLDPAQLISAAEKFGRSIESSVGTEFVPMAEKWMRKQHYLEFIPTPDDAAKAAIDDEFMRAKGFVWDGEKWARAE